MSITGSIPFRELEPRQFLTGAHPTSKEQVFLGRLSGSRRRSIARKQPPTFRPALEGLEERIVPYTVTGAKWGNLTVSASFMPDQTKIATYSTDLQSKYNARYATATWQREFARALQTWATVTPLNFYFVTDTGAAQGSTGLLQGDSRFGDIRLGAYPWSSTGSLAYAYAPSSTSTRGGDIVLNSGRMYNIGTSYDLYSVLVHEVGHSLGLGHSSVAGSVLYSSVTKVYTGLSTDDIAGIKAIYGARMADAYDAKAANNTLATATALPLTDGATTVTADLTTVADVDYYKIVVPAGSDGTLTVSLDAQKVSLLAPKLSLYNATQQLVGVSSAGYGSVATVKLTGLVAGQTYYLAGDGASADVFGMGAYRLNVQFGGFTTSGTSSGTSSGGTTTSGGTSGSPAYALPTDGHEDEECPEHEHHHPVDTHGVHLESPNRDASLNLPALVVMTGVEGIWTAQKVLTESHPNTSRGQQDSWLGLEDTDGFLFSLHNTISIAPAEESLAEWELDSVTDGEEASATELIRDAIWIELERNPLEGSGESPELA